jgi:NADP-dependent 3-hydroxy acid dehydrogenase YdfG
MSYREWRETLDLNLSGVFYCCREALRRFNNNGAGYIINISSLAGKNAFSGGAAYNASKFGLNGFTEAMMLDYRYENIRVSDILPGSVATEFGGAASAEDWKIAPADVAEVVMGLLRMPERTLVSRVEMRPSKPRK